MASVMCRMKKGKHGWDLNIPEMDEHSLERDYDLSCEQKPQFTPQFTNTMVSSFNLSTEKTEKKHHLENNTFFFAKFHDEIPPQPTTWKTSPEAVEAVGHLKRSHWK